MSKAVLVEFKDQEGFYWVVSVLEDTPKRFYDRGIVEGPHNLKDLIEDEELGKKLQEELVKARIYNAPSLLNRRKEVRNILNKLGLPEALERQITSIFQQSYYGGK